MFRDYCTMVLGSDPFNPKITYADEKRGYGYYYEVVTVSLFPSDSTFIMISQCDPLEENHFAKLMVNALNSEGEKVFSEITVDWKCEDCMKKNDD